MHFLVTSSIVLFPVLDDLRAQLFARSAVDSILSNTAFEFFELMFNFLTLCLFFVKFCLQLTSHTVIAILCFFQVKTDLMHVGKSVEILVLVKQLVILLVLIATLSIQSENAALVFIILLLQRLILPAFILNGLNQFTLHLWLTREFSNTTIVGLSIFLFVLLQIIVFIQVTLIHALVCFTRAFVFRTAFASRLAHRGVLA